MAGQQEDPEGIIFDIKRFSTDDGPGIRTTVFLKGCPLNCLWCHSPESRSALPELLFFERRCIRCGSCVAACPEGAQQLDPSGGRRIDRSLCTACGRCEEACPTGSLEICGRRAVASRVVEEVAADSRFYGHSGGGVTLSGGEPASQPDFVRAILADCRKRGIPTALDTTGIAPWEVYAGLLPLVDLFLLDVKQLDPGEHRRLTGARNGPILENLGRLVANGATVQLRLPLIPGLNDSEEHVTAVASLGAELGVEGLALLPYNAAAGAKYSWVGRPYLLEGTVSQPADRLQSLLAAALRQGVRTQLGG